jgi:two-component system, NtrC family, response regulator
MIESAFIDRGFEVTTACDGVEAIKCLRARAFDVVITDLSMPGKDGIEVLKAARERAPETQVILITAYGTIETAVEAMRIGAYDFITKPFQLAELELKVRKILWERDSSSVKPTGAAWHISPARALVGDSTATKQLIKMIERIGPSRSSVMISGPSGTGKELVARALHDVSDRRDEPFVALNCAALAPGVLESELFGHEKGSFSGALEKRIGRFEKAHKGTLFLDEVGEIDGGIQAKLLRVLQENEIERVGGTETIKVDVRIIAATNRQLREAIQKGEFREDFYYRLNVFSLDVKPLRERRDDIPALVEHFLKKFSLETSKNVTEVDDDVLDFFMRYPWPGNVRELENVLERAVVLTDSNRVTREELPQELLYAQIEPETVMAKSTSPSSLIERTDQLESELILGALERFHWNKTKAAEHLGLKRTTLQYKIRKYELE